MTGGAFDRLLYTDCKAGTGRGAGGGFQVQAQSAGVDAAQSKMARGWLLYEVPTAWIAERRPVEEFPLGFAHSAEAGYGTAQSCYLGTEATGARQGNHLADCLLTRDQDRYGPTRPAQLWRSQVWRSTAWPTTDCPQLDDAPPVGPLTVDAIAGWLRA
jgi:GTPase-associated protein 1, N-terminal domain type 2